MAVVALACCGCDDERAPQRADAAPRTAAPVSQDGGFDVPVVRRSRALMSTVFEFVVATPESTRLNAALDDAFAEIARLETILSEWRTDSEISRVNQAAGDGPVKVSRDVLTVVKEGLRVGAESNGAFDISWASLHGIWDFRGAPPTIPDRSTLTAKTKLIDYRKVELDEEASTIRLAREGMAIGLGGIAKGYGLDRAAQILVAAGFHDFVLYGGGQVLASGRRGTRPWRIGIQDPRGEGFFAYFEATSGSASTSGDYERYFVLDGVRYHHIIDTRTGMPARGLVSVTVLADTAVRADALSTAVFVLGAQKGLALARELGFEAVLIDEQMQVLATDRIRASLRARRLPPPTGP